MRSKYRLLFDRNWYDTVCYSRFVITTASGTQREVQHVTPVRQVGHVHFSIAVNDNTACIVHNGKNTIFLPMQSSASVCFCVIDALAFHDPMQRPRRVSRRTTKEQPSHSGE